MNLRAWSLKFRGVGLGLVLRRCLWSGNNFGWFGALSLKLGVAMVVESVVQGCVVHGFEFGSGFQCSGSGV